jgi:hypothetical protein
VAIGAEAAAISAAIRLASGGLRRTCRQAALVLVLSAAWLPAQESHGLSPDGRLAFHAYSPDEVERGSPPFGVVETGSRKLVWRAPDELGDASRPEESLHWAPDSRRFALTTRIGTRRMATFFFGLKDGAFQSLPWNQAGRLEALAHRAVTKQKNAAGFTGASGNGRVLLDDITVERWIDPDTVSIRRRIETHFEEEEKHATFEVSVVAVLKWKKGEFVIEKAGVEKSP